MRAIPFFTYPCESLRVDRGVGCKGFDEHVHTETMGWPAHVTTWLVYLTHGAPLTVHSRSLRVAPAVIHRVRADTPHGVAPSDGLCPVSGLRRAVVLITGEE